MDGDTLRAYRKRHGLTQQQLALGAGVTANTVARWERGERPVPLMLSRLLDAWDLSYELDLEARFLRQHARGREARHVISLWDSVIAPGLGHKRRRRPK